MPYLQLHDVHVHYPLKSAWGVTGRVVRAVDGVSLVMERGDVLGLVGESGCGKSSLSRAIMQLQPITSGSIILDGELLSALPARELRRRRTDFQMVFQDPYASLNPRFTIYSTLLEALTRRQLLKRNEREEAVAQLMLRVGLSPEHMHKYPHEFSGGQRQRVAIARAIAPRPKLLLADEPVSALDVSIRGQILNLLLKLTRELGLTMLFISHDLLVVQHVASHIAVMQCGRIVEYGDAEQVFTRPQHPYTRQLLSAVPKL